MDAAIIWDEAYAEHDTGEHPEGADRIAAVVGHLRGTDLWDRLVVVDVAAAGHGGRRPSGPHGRRTSP